MFMHVMFVCVWLRPFICLCENDVRRWLLPLLVWVSSRRTEFRSIAIVMKLDGLATMYVYIYSFVDVYTYRHWQSTLRSVFSSSCWLSLFGWLEILVVLVECDCERHEIRASLDRHAVLVADCIFSWQQLLEGRIRCVQDESTVDGPEMHTAFSIYDCMFWTAVAAAIAPLRRAEESFYIYTYRISYVQHWHCHHPCVLLAATTNHTHTLHMYIG